MRHFFRVLKYSWPYRYRLLASIVCALLVAALWGASLSAIYPVLKIISEKKSLQQWVDEEIDNNQKQLDDRIRRQRIEDLRAALKQLDQNPATPVTETHERKATQELAKLEGELNYYGVWVYRYLWLKTNVLRHIPQDRFKTVLWILIAVVIGVMIKGVFEFMHESLVGNVTFRTLFDLRNAFFHRAIHQDVRQLTSTGTSDLMARFTNDVEQTGVGLKVLFGKMVGEPLKMITCVIVACMISWQLTLVFVVIVPVALVILVRVSKMMRRAARKALEQMSAMYKLVRETFDSIRAVKGFTRESHERRKFRDASREYLRKAMRMTNIDAATGPIVEVLVVLAVGMALASGMYLVVTGSTHIWGFRMTNEPLGFPALLQLYAFLVATADPVRRLSSVYTKIQAGDAAAGRVFEVFDRIPAVKANPEGSRLDEVRKHRSGKRAAAQRELEASLGRPPSSEELAAKLGIPLEQLDILIEFRHICFSYNPEKSDSPTLDDVCLAVRTGETIAIVGGNGCGKTTLLSLLPRFFDPDSGAVLVDGVNIRTAHLRTLRKMIGLVTQDTQLFDDTVFSNIAFGKRGATREEVIKAAKKAHAHEFILRDLENGYETVIGEMGVKLSGGQRQRIALARAILRNPSILILDEFSSAIDPTSEAEIHEALKEFVKGRTVFLITHKLHTLEIADRIVVMDFGRVIDVGTHAELIVRCPIYQRLCDPGSGRLAA